MKPRSYLPSAQFSTLVGSIGLAGLLILGAQYITSPHTSPATVASTSDAAQNEDWQQQLDFIQATAPSLPAAPSQDTVNQLLGAAQSSNLTDSAARSLLINLSNAQAQGLGADTPTQDSLVSQAIAQLAPVAAAHVYTKDDLNIVDSSAINQKAYGNAVMEVLGRHQSATSEAVLLAVSLALDNNDAKQLDALGPIQKEYTSLAADLAALPVPQTLVPLHLQVTNDISLLATNVANIQTLLTDSLRGLQALQQYKLTLGETGRVFTSIAQLLSRGGILFTKDEPGSAWSVFLSS